VSRFARHARLASLAVGAAAVLAACGTNPASSGPGGSGAAASLAPGTFAVEAKEYQFTPSTLSVPAGEVTFQIHNAGTQEHEFEIFQGDKVVDEVEDIVPGISRDLTVTLAAGDYTFVCALNGHDAIGMKGTITVTG